MNGGTRSIPGSSRSELLADTVVHVSGFGAAAASCALLGALALPSAGLLEGVTLGLYSLGLLVMLGCSALYNLAGEGPRKARLRQFDHAAIFLMIAGTYTPVALLGVGGGAGWAIACAVWVGALAGAAIKLLTPARFERSAIIVYLLLGWAGLAVLEALLDRLAPTDLALLVAGGVVYSGGVPVHLATRLPYNNALWHCLVVVAAACHYVVVLRLAMHWP